MFALDLMVVVFNHEQVLEQRLQFIKTATHQKLLVEEQALHAQEHL
jgi:plasmid maintenance system killer protein